MNNEMPNLGAAIDLNMLNLDYIFHHNRYKICQNPLAKLVNGFLLCWI